MDQRHPPADDSEGDLRKLAEDWITIWQSEITAFMADPETQQSWGSLMALWGGAAQAMVRAMPQGVPYPNAGWPPSGATSDRSRQSAGPSPSPGPPPAAAAPDSRDDEIRRLERRVAELERYLAPADSGGDGAPPRTPRRAAKARRVGN
ncbi:MULTISPECIES: hypothetical protein [unclassified Acidisoma]|jgi:hypothetical protein|uniref:hypothetical protein n=1 Tax=unclassified Acidisoma TaxID=2634065 RepID=UPI0020B128FA|nr:MULTISPECIES: hypothetical protein [unclassified Acidisoma]